jgi:hypothetical protein
MTFVAAMHGAQEPDVPPESDPTPLKSVARARDR